MAQVNVDVVVVGAGPGGYVAAIRAAQKGLSVAVVERKAELGGTCLNWGCIPTKAMVATARTLSHIRHAGEFGVVVGEAKLDAAALHKRLRGIVDTLNKNIGMLFKKNKIALIPGTARFTGPATLTATAKDGTVSEIRFGHAIVATGSSPIEIPALPFVAGKVVPSDALLFRDQLPRSLLIIGGGVIGCEFASIYSQFGVPVTVVEALDQVLPMTDKDVADVVTKALTKRGVTVKTGAKVEKVDASGAECVVHLAGGEQLRAAEVCVAVGRRANGAGLGLEELSVKVERGAIKVDGHCRTAIPTIFAIGDCNGRIQLAHAASHDGIAAVDTILGGHARFADAATCPGNIFTDPEVGIVGLTDKAAAAAGTKVKVGKFPYLALGRARCAGETEGFFKVVADAQTEQILGVQIVGAEATDLIQQGVLMVAGEMTLSSVGHLIHGHPTLPEGIMEACLAARGEVIHG
ncbi:MAG TPA: dihydrolipoyl dehydrogenase [Planctomycetota bacterium]|nr:dihydrolipoyl dehydrogenase [Planctomycetota bacterium]